MNKRDKPAKFRWLKGFFQDHMYGMITCREFDEFIGSYFDGDLSRKQLFVFRAHIRFCRECRQYLKAYQRALQVGRAVFPSMDAPVPDDVPEDLIKAILDSRNG